jgi:KipI family sensor histidine kinase inhibitor
VSIDVTATWFGDRAVLVSVPTPDLRGAAVARLSAAFPSHVVRPGLSSVLVEAAEPDRDLLAAVHAIIADLEPSGQAADSGRVVEIAVVYDGADLAGVASALGREPSDVVAAHQRQDWLVAMMGFAPGFGYLLPVGPERLPWGELPRRERPRVAVPAGSVAVAAGMSAVYPVEMPGGWHLLGTTSARLFDPTAQDEPTLLRPGDVVRFREAP